MTIVVDCMSVDAAGAVAIVTFFVIATLALANKILSSFRVTKKKAKQTKPWPTVPGSFLFGNTLALRSSKTRIRKLHEWADKYGAACGAFEVNLMGISHLVVCDEEATLQIMRQRPFKVIRNRAGSSAIKSLGGNGLFSNEGDDWRQDKRLVSPALSHAAVEKYFPTVKTVTRRLVDKWSKLSSDGSAVEINQDCYRVMIDLVGLVMLGNDFQSLCNPDSVSGRDLTTMGSILPNRALCPIWYWKIPFIGNYLDGAAWTSQRIDRSLHDVVTKHERGHSTVKDQTTFVAKLVAINKQDENRLSRSRMKGNVLTMFVGGTDSTSATLATSIWLIATDTTGLQEELADEARGVNFETITPGDLEGALPRLQSFLYETQRVYSAFPIMPLEVSEEIGFMGTTLPKGRQIMCLLRYTGTNPHKIPTGAKVGPNGEDHTEFCPRRWLVADDCGKVSAEAPDTRFGAFLSFGHGIRACPGRHFSEAVSLFLLSSLLAKFRISLQENHPPVGRTMGLAEFPDVDILVHFKTRE